MSTPARTTGASVADLAFEPRPEVAVGLIGAGGRMRGLLDNLFPVPHVRVVAIADTSEEAVSRLVTRAVAAGLSAPAAHHGPEAAEHLLARPDIDLVLVATPWNSHASLAVQAMRAGKHVGVEVPAATTLADCWALVDASEETQRHCVMLENCCYGETELLVLNLVRAGLLGDLLHAECSYTHDLRADLMETQAWRRQAHIDRSGNLYPTHGLGPVAGYLGINRGDRFTRLVSMDSPSIGLQTYRDRTVAADDPRRAEAYRNADINTSLIQTALGRTVMLQHQVIGPRPYERRNQLVGTNGIYSDYPSRIQLEDDPLRPGVRTAQEREEFCEIGPYLEAYGHALWRLQGERALQLGTHGGMDYLMLFRLIETIRLGLVPDIDVYDAAAWSAPGPLSADSLEAGSMPIEFPDFLRGEWQRTRPGLLAAPPGT